MMYQKQSEIRRRVVAALARRKCGSHATLGDLFKEVCRINAEEHKRLLRKGVQVRWMGG